MCLLIPFTNERFQLCPQVVVGCKIHDAQALALKNTQPLLHLIHPGTMHGREVHHNAWMLGYPRPDFLAMMRTDMIAHQMNRVDVGVNLCLHRFQEGDKLPLTLPFLTVPIDLARPGVKGRTEMQGTRPCILVLVPVGQVLRPGWQGRA
jgi:hypothetical protein